MKCFLSITTLVVSCAVFGSCLTSSVSSDSEDGTTAPTTPAASPTFETDFQSNNNQWVSTLGHAGTTSFGVSSAGAEDGIAATITVDGDPAGSGSHSSVPSVSNQLRRSEATGYGMYRARVKPASCTGNEDMVTGIFAYANDDVTDANGNGIIDNNEIDFEILCGEPQTLYITSWTDYTDDEHLQKLSRMIDFKTGRVYQTEPGHEGEYGLGDDPVDTMAAATRPDLSLTSDYHEMGFEWSASRLRFFLVVDGREITLWDLQDARYLPKPPVQFMLNVWYPGEHWYNGEAADFPASDATLSADWFRYWDASAL